MQVMVRSLHYPSCTRRLLKMSLHLQWNRRIRMWFHAEGLPLLLFLDSFFLPFTAAFTIQSMDFTSIHSPSAEYLCPYRVCQERMAVGHQVCQERMIGVHLPCSDTSELKQYANFINYSRVELACWLNLGFRLPQASHLVVLIHSACKDWQVEEWWIWKARHN